MPRTSKTTISHDLPVSVLGITPRQQGIKVCCQGLVSAPGKIPFTEEVPNWHQGERWTCLCTILKARISALALTDCKISWRSIMNPICLDLVRDDADIPQYPRTQSNYEASGGTISTPHNPSTCLHVSASLPRTSRSAFTFTWSKVQ